MPDLSYSDDALNVRGAFFGVKVIVYVEGDDDVLFWTTIFERITNEQFEVESLGGAPMLDTYIQKIASGELNAIAARDADFLPTLNACFTHPKIIYTRGYSIENSLYVSYTITQLARSWCKSARITTTDCSKWLDTFATSISPLVYLDVANAISSEGIPTLGDNCSRYMTSENSATACSVKVANAAAMIQSKVSPTALATASASVGNAPCDVLTHLRGHFLASAVHRYIVKQAKSYGRKASISSESLYAAAIAQFASYLDAEHPHRQHYIESAQKAWNAI